MFSCFETEPALVIRCVLLSLQKGRKTVKAARCVQYYESISGQCSFANCHLMLVQLHRRGAGLVRVVSIVQGCYGVLLYVLLQYLAWHSCWQWLITALAASES